MALGGRVRGRKIFYRWGMIADKLPLLGVGEVSFLEASPEATGGECLSEDGLAPSADGLELDRKEQRREDCKSPGSSGVTVQLFTNFFF